jgi:hypothetical protein
MKTRLLCLAAAALLAGCVHLPPAPAEMSREPLQRGMSTTCRPRGCSGSVAAGNFRYDVDTRIDERSLEHVLAGTRPSVMGRVAGAVGDDLARRAFGMTEQRVASLVRRTVGPRGRGAVMICDLVWVDAESRTGAEPEVTRSRIGEGQSCLITPTGDSADATWRFRAGAPTASDSLHEHYGHLLEDAGSGVTRANLPMWLERIAPPGTAASYEVLFDGYVRLGGVIHGFRTVVVRDSVTIARLHLVEEHGRSAIDFGPATAEERGMIRLLAAHLLMPNRRG